MTRYLSLLLVLTAGLAGALVPASARAQAPPAGFTAMFNGKDVTGLVGMPARDPRQVEDLAPETEDTQRQADQAAFRQHWRVENGELVNDGTGPYATSQQNYADIELRLEYRTAPKADTTLYLRGTPQQQWKAAVAKAARPAGQWNALRILQLGERTTIYVNNTLVVDHERMTNSWDPKLPLARTGRIQLQGQGGDVRWRGVYVRAIPTDEANRLLAAKSAAGFTAIFNGRDLTGWAGAIANYQVVDGVIMCKPNEGGVLYFDKTYSNFVARLEIKLSPGGNNGLAIRYPGKGDTAYVGMTELQVLDDNSDRYLKLDPRQYHGSIYGMVAAQRGYLRPQGEWNFQEVTVQGSRIKVELNGTVITDADVSTVTEFAGNRQHPGRTRTDGFFGFAGHSEPIQFRQVQIKEIK